MNTFLKIEQHSTPEDLFEALSRVFGMKENNGVRWVSFRAGDVDLTFFGTLKAETQDVAA